MFLSLPLRFLWSCFAILCLATAVSSQCMYVSEDPSGQKQGVGFCIRASPTESIMFSCDATSVTQKYFNATADCTGTVQNLNATSTYNGTKVCTGDVCSFGSESYATADCTGTATPRAIFLDPTCQPGGGTPPNYAKNYCDSSFFYSYSYGTADATCSNNQNSPGASIIQYGVGVCQNTTSSSSSPSSFKIASCNLPASIPKPTLTLANSIGVTSYQGANSACAGTVTTQSTTLIGKCESSGSGSTATSSNSYCSGNGGAYWGFSYGAANCASNLKGAFYFNTGCLPPFLFGGISAQQTYAVSCSGSAPPSIDFGGAQYGLVTIYIDSACTKLAYGGYGKTDGMCEASTSTSASGALILASKSVCTSNKMGVVTTYFSASNCSAGSIISNETESYDQTCKRAPTLDSNGQMFYAKVDSCGQTTPVTPANAPGIKTISAGVSKGVSFVVVCLGLAHFTLAL